LLIATILAVVLGRFQQKATQVQAEKIGGSVWEGAISVFKSRYLLFACLMMLLHNLTSTFLYNGLAVFVDENISGFNERTVFFAYIDFAVQIIAFSLQFFITSRLIKTLGMPRTLIGVPLILAAGFVLMGSTMGLVLFAAVQVLQRSMNYGILGPAKEMLFTVVDRETKYKSKNFIDTAVYRGSDVAASWIFKGLTNTGLGLGQIAFTYLPIMGLWAWGAWRLGSLYQKQLNSQGEAKG
jgi:AAA family ATP:ADP antiporter